MLTELITHIPDIERLLSRLCVNLGNARDLVNLKLALGNILMIKKALDTLDTPDTLDTLLKELKVTISTKLSKLITYIDTMIIY